MTHTPEDDTRLERKVQLTGGSTYTVSLPKKWAKQQGIEPGVMVDLHPRDGRLVVTQNRASDNLRQVTIQTAEHDEETLARAVGAAYVGGADEIVLEVADDTGDRRTATQAIRRFVGLEVMDEDEGALTARTMLDSPDLPPRRAVTQMRRTAVKMHSEAVAAVVAADGDQARRVGPEDDTVDRLFALVSRAFQRSLVDPATPVRRDSHSLFEHYTAARQLERVADHAEKMATIADQLASPPPVTLANAIESHGTASRAVVEDSLAGLLDGSSEGDLVGVIEDADSLLAEIDELDEQLYESERTTASYRLGGALNSILRTVKCGVNIAEAGLRADYRADSRN
ncbi:MAG: phosphate uptake regulator [halophilic archaeon J07HX5]|jgi:Phosphate uptake regulator|nr:MAG: phosphate uptake regulator [halophilic archaeon J07HX5]